MTRSIIEDWGLLAKWPSKHDAHRWLRSRDRRILRLTSQAKYGNNRVQEIVSGTLWPKPGNGPPLNQSAKDN